jgi:hypothetical protein
MKKPLSPPTCAPTTSEISSTLGALEREPLNAKTINAELELVASVAMSPEQVLWARVLADGIRCARGIVCDLPGRKERFKEFVAAKEWLKDETAYHVGSFRWIVDILGMNGEHLAKLIKEGTLTYLPLLITEKPIHRLPQKSFAPSKYTKAIPSSPPQTYR